MNNKCLGNEFESEMVKYMQKKHNVWVYRFPNKHNGQPADILCMYGGMAELIDCKVCSNDTFLLLRVEENQITAMKRFQDVSENNVAIFYFKWSDGKVTGVYYDDIIEFSNVKSRVTRLELEKVGWEVDMG